MQTGESSETQRNPSRRNFLKYAIAGAGVAGLAAVGGSAYYKFAYLPSQAPSTFSLGYYIVLPNTLTMAAAQSQNYFGENKIIPQITQFPDLATGNNAFIHGDVTFSWNTSVQTVASARAQGAKLQLIYPQSLSDTSVLVRNNSPYQTIYDLKGKKVGTFALPEIQYVIGSQVWNKDHPNNPIDPVKDFSYTQAPLNVLVQALISGQVEAISVFTPLLQQAKAQGARAVFTASDEWKKLTGKPLLVSYLGAQQSYIEQNGKITKELVRAIQESQAYVLKNPTFIDNNIKSMFNYSDTSLIEQIRNTSMNNLSVGNWDDEDVSILNRFSQLLKQYGTITSVPNDLFSNKYNV